jgi:hypothetical protein
MIKNRMGGNEKIFQYLIIVLLGSLLSMMMTGSLWAWIRQETGQTKCYNDSVEIGCPESGKPLNGQDSQYQGPNHSYTKLGQSGVTLANHTTQTGGWLMTQDSVTGLVWEMKTDDNSINDKAKVFTWCDKNSATNGGNQGICGTSAGSAATDTEAFIKALNDANFGGFSDWRIPTIKELTSLVKSSIPYPGLTIDTASFPNTASSGYWSSTTYAADTHYAWRVHFYFGFIYSGSKSDSYHVRAVRAGKLQLLPFASRVGI